MKSDLKEARLSNKFTQLEAAKFLGVSLRSYKTYETQADKKKTIKYEYMFNKLMDNSLITETKGILTIDDIKEKANKIFKEYEIEYCYLFGSYAKGKQKENSDIDLLISTNIDGLKFYGLVEKLREELHKEIDLLNVNQLENNISLTNEILKDGIKIYG